MSVPTHSQLNILCAVVVIFDLNIKLLSLGKDVSSAFFNKPHSLIFDTISVDSILLKWAYALHLAAGVDTNLLWSKATFKTAISSCDFSVLARVKKCEEA